MGGPPPRPGPRRRRARTPPLGRQACNCRCCRPARRRPHSPAAAAVAARPAWPRRAGRNRPWPGPRPVARLRAVDADHDHGDVLQIGTQTIPVTSTKDWAAFSTTFAVDAGKTATRHGRRHPRRHGHAARPHGPGGAPLGRRGQRHYARRGRRAPRGVRAAPGHGGYEASGVAVEVFGVEALRK